MVNIIKNEALRGLEIYTGFPLSWAGSSHLRFIVNVEGRLDTVFFFFFFFFQVATVC